MSKKVYDTSLRFIYVIAGLGGIGLFAGYWENGYTTSFKDGLVIFVATLLFLTMDRRLLTAVVITENRIVVKNGIFTKNTGCELQSIAAIERVHQFLGAFFKTEGSRMKITYIEANGQERSFQITEKQYSVETLKELLLQLKKIKPGLQVDAQYENLLKGKYDDKNFHRLPAEKYGIEKLDNLGH